MMADFIAGVEGAISQPDSLICLVTECPAFK